MATIKVKVKKDGAANATTSWDKGPKFDRLFEDEASPEGASTVKELNLEDFQKKYKLDEDDDDEKIAEDVRISPKNNEGEDTDKKPVYKQWWFWVLLVLLLAAIGYGIYYYTTQKDATNPDNGATTTTVAGEQANTNNGNANDSTSIIPDGALVIKGSEGWGLYQAGSLVKNYTGLAENDLGTWYIKNGLVDFNFNGNVVQDGVSYTIENGKVTYASAEANNNGGDNSSGNAANTNSANSNDNSVNAEATAADPFNVNGTDSQKAALTNAQNYLSEMSFSYDWLVAQVKADGFSDADAKWAADNCGADWNEQAYKKAKEYLQLTSFTHSDMVTQLEFEGFTHEQAEYGANKAGV